MKMTLLFFLIATGLGLTGTPALGHIKIAETVRQGTVEAPGTRSGDTVFAADNTAFFLAVSAIDKHGVKSLTLTVTDATGSHTTRMAGAPRHGRYPTVLSLGLAGKGVHRRTIMVFAQHPVTVTAVMLKPGNVSETATMVCKVLDATLTPRAAPSALAVTARNAAKIYLYAETAQAPGMVQIAAMSGLAYSDTLVVGGNGGTFYLIAMAHDTQPPGLASGCPPDSVIVLCRSATVAAWSAPAAPPGTLEMSLSFYFDNHKRMVDNVSVLFTGVWAPGAAPAGASGLTHFSLYMPLAQFDYVTDAKIATPIAPLAYGNWTVNAASQELGVCVVYKADYEPGANGGAVINVDPEPGTPPLPNC